MGSIANTMISKAWVRAGPGANGSSMFDGQHIGYTLLCGIAETVVISYKMVTHLILLQ
jgi:hypothetical protein